MELNLILLCIGLLLCFGGIYLRRLCAALVGLGWGIVLGIILMFAAAVAVGGSLYGIDEGYLWILLLTAATVTILSAVYYRLCVVVNAFLSVVFFVLLILIAIQTALELLPCLIIAALFGSVIAYFAYLYYNYAFIVVTAFSGAFMASIGGFGLINQMTVDEMLGRILYGYEFEGMPIVFATIVLGVCGCVVQSCGLQKMDGQGTSAFQRKMTGGGEKKMPPIKISFGAVSDYVKKESLLDTVMQELPLLMVPVILFIAIPLFWQNSYNWNLPGGVYTLVSWLQTILRAAVLGMMVYFLLNYDWKFNVAFNCIYPVVYVLLYMKNFQYGIDFYIVVSIMNFLIMYGVMYLVARIIQGDEYKPVLLSIIVILLDSFVIDFLRYRSIFFVPSIRNFLSWAVTIGTVYVLFLYKNDIHMFDFSSRESYRTAWDAEEKRCPRCGNMVSESAAYCDRCGTKL